MLSKCNFISFFTRAASIVTCFTTLSICFTDFINIILTIFRTYIITYKFFCNIFANKRWKIYITTFNNFLFSFFNSFTTLYVTSINNFIIFFRILTFLFIVIFNSFIRSDIILQLKISCSSVFQRN